MASTTPAGAPITTNRPDSPAAVRPEEPDPGSSPGRASTVTPIATVRADVPTLGQDAVVGPVRADDGDIPQARALVRFDYAQGAAVTASLKGSVVSAALRTRRVKGKPARTTLRVRLDVADPQL